MIYSEGKDMYALIQEGDYVLDRTYLSNYFWAGDK